ncbi:putative inorganic carbon transporter subunit DabA [Dyadobacter beijingensis]|nr:putative inorganic carbon transporter subunit DabA [Dyadobacter beijingensis]
MTARKSAFDEETVLHELKRFLPAMSPSRTFTYQNPLRGFQDRKFHDAAREANEILGIGTTLLPEEYRAFYNSKRVKPDILEKVVLKKKGAARTFEWQDKVLMKKFGADASPRIGKLRAAWKKQYKIDLDEEVHPTLFRLLGACLAPRTAAWQFPVRGLGFLDSMREMEANSLVSVFKTVRARNLLLHTRPGIADLLQVVVGDETHFQQYLFDQQFAHRGWSGLVMEMEDRNSLFSEGRMVAMYDLVIFELLLEIDALDHRLKNRWQPLSAGLAEVPGKLFAPVPASEKHEVLAIWQEAVEWSYYDQLLSRLYHRTGAEPHSRPLWPAHGRPEESPAAKAPGTTCLIGGPLLARNFPADDLVSINPYDFADDPEGELLAEIFETAIPSCGAINLEYFFSRTGLNNRPYAAAEDTPGLVEPSGAKGDLRTGLPARMAERDVPMRLLCVTEHYPETVLKVIGRLGSARSWLVNEWVHLVVVDPDTRELSVLRNGKMVAYKSDRRLAAVH